MASDSGTSEPIDSDLVSVGDLIDGRYRIEELIARGGQASVWKASQEPLQRTVALKVLTAPPTREGSEPFRERFLLEAKTLAALNHPNIVIVYDYGRITSGCYYIAMEHVEGVRFSRILRQRPIDAARRLRLIEQVCGALRYAHQRGVIHRDVKNANILVREDSAGAEEVKVVDFGIVKLMESDPGITQEGVILGSPHFMSPEQITGAFFDHRADIYAVGVLLYCAVTGRYPYRGKDARTIMTNHLKQPIPKLKSRDPRLVGDQEFEGIVRRCLAKRPDDRFADMDSLMAALQPYSSGARFEETPVDLDAEVLEELTDEVEDLITGRTEQAEMALHPFHDGGTSMTAEMGAMVVDDEEEKPTSQTAAIPRIGVVDIQKIAGIQEVMSTDYDPEEQLRYDPAVAYTGAPDFTVISEDDVSEGDVSEDDVPEEAPAVEALTGPPEPAAEAPPEERLAAEADSEEPDREPDSEEPDSEEPDSEEPAAAQEEPASEAVEPPQPPAEPAPTPATPTAAVIPELDEPVSDSRLFKIWIVAFVGTLVIAGIAGRMLGLF